MYQNVTLHDQPLTGRILQRQVGVDYLPPELQDWHAIDPSQWTNRIKPIPGDEAAPPAPQDGGVISSPPVHEAIEPIYRTATPAEIAAGNTYWYNVPGGGYYGPAPAPSQGRSTLPIARAPANDGLDAGSPAPTDPFLPSTPSAGSDPLPITTPPGSGAVGPNPATLDAILSGGGGGGGDSAPLADPNAVPGAPYISGPVVQSTGGGGPPIAMLVVLALIAIGALWYWQHHLKGAHSPNVPGGVAKVAPPAVHRFA